MKRRICNTNPEKKLNNVAGWHGKNIAIYGHFVPTYVSFIICLCIANEFKFKVSQRMGKFSLGCWKICKEKKAETEG